jgi:hypothetical protein
LPVAVAALLVEQASVKAEVLFRCAQQHFGHNGIIQKRGPGDRGAHSALGERTVDHCQDAHRGRGAIIGGELASGNPSLEHTGEVRKVNLHLADDFLLQRWTAWALAPSIEPQQRGRVVLGGDGIVQEDPQLGDRTVCGLGDLGGLLFAAPFGRRRESRCGEIVALRLRQQRPLTYAMIGQGGAGEPALPVDAGTTPEGSK